MSRINIAEVPVKPCKCMMCAYYAGGSAEMFDHQKWVEKRAVAEKRSRALLKSMLSINQKRTLNKDGYFIVTGSLGGKYRIYTWWNTFNVFRYEPRSGAITARYCLQLKDGYMPQWDVILTQAIEITTNEKQFWTTAEKISPSPDCVNVIQIDNHHGPYAQFREVMRKQGFV